MRDVPEALTLSCEAEVPSPGRTSSQLAGPRVRDVMSSHYVTASPRDTLLSVVTAMSENRALCAVVLHDGTIQGVLTQENILPDVSNGANFGHLTVDQRLPGLPQTIEPDTLVSIAAERMLSGRVDCLPVLHGDRLVGVVTQKHLTRGLLSLHPLKCAADILAGPVATVDTGASVAQASEIMIAKATSCVIALRQGVPAGIVTSKDLLRRVAAARRDPIATQVVEIMSFPLISIPPSYSILSTARRMDALNLHSLVVMTGDHLHGIVTQRDVLKALQAEIDWIGQPPPTR